MQLVMVMCAGGGGKFQSCLKDEIRGRASRHLTMAGTEELKEQKQLGVVPNDEDAHGGSAAH